MNDQQTTGNLAAAAAATADTTGAWADHDAVNDLNLRHELAAAARWADQARAAAETMGEAYGHLKPGEMMPEEHAAIVQARASLSRAYTALASVRLVQSASDALAEIAHEVSENFHLGSIADVLGNIAHDLRRVDSR